MYQSTSINLQLPLYQESTQSSSKEYPTISSNSPQIKKQLQEAELTQLVKKKCRRLPISGKLTFTYDQKKESNLREAMEKFQNSMIDPDSIVSTLMLLSFFQEEIYTQKHLELIDFLLEICPCQTEPDLCPLPNIILKEQIHSKIRAAGILISEKIYRPFRHIFNGGNHTKLWEVISAICLENNDNLEEMEQYSIELEKLYHEKIMINQVVNQKLNPISFYYIRNIQEDLYDLIYGGIDKIAFEGVTYEDIKQLSKKFVESILALLKYFEIKLKKTPQSDKLPEMFKFFEILELKDLEIIWEMSNRLFCCAMLELSGILNEALEIYFAEDSFFIESAVGDFGNSVLYQRNIGNINWKELRTLQLIWRSLYQRNSSHLKFEDKRITIFQIHIRQIDGFPKYLISKIIIEQQNYLKDNIQELVQSLISELDSKKILPDEHLKTPCGLILTISTTETEEFEEITQNLDFSKIKRSIQNTIPTGPEIELYPQILNLLFDEHILYRILLSEKEIDFSTLPIIHTGESTCIGRELIEIQLKELQNISRIQLKPGNQSFVSYFNF